jgi:hypothetical protein
MVRLFEDTNIKAIADAIRAKTGTSQTYKTNEMASAIENIQSGGAISLVEGTASVSGDVNNVKIAVSGKTVESIRAIRLVSSTGTTASIGSSGRLLEMFVDIVNSKICFMQYVYNYEASTYSIGGNITVNATITLNSGENSITVSSSARANGIAASMPTGSWKSYIVYEE